MNPFKMKIIISLLFVWLWHIGVSGQKNDYNWIIGGNSINTFKYDFQWGTSIADFNLDPVEFKYDSLITMDMSGTNVSLSDDYGKLLMYSNGMHVHNSFHKNIPGLDTISYSDYWENFNIKDYLPDGSDWLAGFPGRQWNLMLPDPGSKDYYIFHPLRILRPNGQFTQTIGLMLTKVAISAENPTGKVIYKDSLIASGTFQWGINAVRHANGRDWWVIHSSEYNEAFYIYLLDPNGLRLTNKFSGTTKINQATSYIVGYFSPDGSHYVTSESLGLYFDTTLVNIYNFDRCSGSIERKEFKKLEESQLIYGALSFSPDGRYLYVNDGIRMLQYDMMEDSILPTEKTIATYDGSKFQYNEWDSGTKLIFSSMAQGPDGRIYCIPPGNTRSIHTIEYPEEYGEAATMLQNSIKLPTQNFNSIPNFPNFRTGPLDGSLCDTLDLDNMPVAKFRYEQDTSDHLRLRFTDLSYFGPDSWEWDFGDSVTFDGRKPYWHHFAKEGEYNVCLKVSNVNGTKKYCRIIRLGDPISSSETEEMARISIFPNPVETDLLVTLSEYVPSDGRIEIFDIVGNLINKYKVYYGQNSIDVSNLISGTYVYRFYDGKKIMKVGKIVKI